MMDMTTCSACDMDTAGRHAWDCPNNRKGDIFVTVNKYACPDCGKMLDSGMIHDCPSRWTKSELDYSTIIELLNKVLERLDEIEDRL